MGREIYDIINDMAEVLNASQMQKILGHEQIDTTLRYYAMVNQNNVKLSHRKYIS